MIVMHKAFGYSGSSASAPRDTGDPMPPEEIHSMYARLATIGVSRSLGRDSDDPIDSDAPAAVRSRKYHRTKT